MTDLQRRARRKTLTDKMVASLPPHRQRYFHPDPEMPSHGVRVLPDGPSSFYVVARDAFKRQRWVRIGGTAELTVEESRERSRAVLKRLKAGLAPFEPPPIQADSFAAVAENWFKRYIEKNKLRTGNELKRVLERYVTPHWRDRVFVDIRRSDVAALLDAVEDAHGHWTADAVLAVLGALMSWHSTRDDNYTPPLVKKMRRTPQQLRKRSRILSDDELRKVWPAAGQAGVFGAFLQLLLLTGQRRAKLADLRWDDLDGNVWRIRSEPREKGNPGSLKLPRLAMAVLEAQPHISGNPHVFAGRTVGPLRGFADRHAVFRASCGVDGWTLHDLRRTARSLMSRAGVISEHAERVLGHVIAGVAGTYDRHSYADEKAIALAKLASLVADIVDDNKPSKVVKLKGRVGA